VKETKDSESEERDGRIKFEFGLDKKILYTGIGIFAAWWVLPAVLGMLFWLFIMLIFMCKG
jgi:hypothetical protein